MDFINSIVDTMNHYLWSYILIVLLIGSGLYFTVKTNFVQFRHFKEMWRLLLTKNKKGSNGVSSFQAFCISTASRVGTGNIAGVAMALSIGGPGAVFWMWLIALLGSSTSFIESTLAQIYKVNAEDGSFKGGPAYYMEKGLNKRWMGLAFAILISISFGLILSGVQSNTISESFNSVFGIDKSIAGLIIAILSLIIVLGGVKRIAKMLEIIVPVFAGAYILITLFVVFKNITLLPIILRDIFLSAFGIKEMATGALVGAIMQGVKRGLFSNEAGMGSAPNASATADVEHPVSQGLVQSAGVFVDTIIICSSTAFLVLISGSYTDKTLEGIQITQAALSSQVGSFGAIFISLSIFLFAFSSIIGNYCYGEMNLAFITKNKKIMFIYNILFALMLMLGSVAKVSLVWNLADVFMGLMAILNIIAIFMLRKDAFDALKDYDNQKKHNIKTPVYKKDIGVWGE